MPPNLPQPSSFWGCSRFKRGPGYLGAPQTPPLYPTGGGLLQGGLPGAGELRNSFTAGKNPERLEETGPDEDLLLRRRGPREFLGLGGAPLALSPPQGQQTGSGRAEFLG